MQNIAPFTEIGRNINGRADTMVNVAVLIKISTRTSYNL